MGLINLDKKGSFGCRYLSFPFFSLALLPENISLKEGCLCVPLSLCSLAVK